MKQEFIRCHDFLANRTARLVELLGQAESRGYLLEDSLTLVETTSWLQMIDWQTNFLTLVMNFTKEPGSKTLKFNHRSDSFRPRARMSRSVSKSSPISTLPFVTATKPGRMMMLGTKSNREAERMTSRMTRFDRAGSSAHCASGP